MAAIDSQCRSLNFMNAREAARSCNSCNMRCFALFLKLRDRICHPLQNGNRSPSLGSNQLYRHYDQVLSELSVMHSIEEMQSYDYNEM